MTDPRLSAFLRLGQSVGGYADSPQWARIMADTFPKQREFVEHGDIAKAGRGSGKSHGHARKFHRRSHLFPGKSAVFVTLSSERSRDILLPALEQLSEKYHLGLREYRKANAMVWPNGYRVLFRGCKDRVEANKRRGTPWVEAGWDECFVRGTHVRPVGEVLGVSAKPAPDSLIEIDGVVSTPDHPYWTTEGWKLAKDIQPGDLLCVWDPDATCDAIPAARDLFEGVLLGGQGPQFAWSGPDSAKSNRELEADSARRERYGSDSGGTGPERIHWFDDATRRQDRIQREMGRCWVSSHLQVGFGGTIGEAGGRGGWAEPSVPRAPCAGRKEGSVASLKRVDRVEVHQRGGPGRYDSLCPDGLVYNLKTSSGLYFAGGRLVHNCDTINSNLLEYDIHECVEPRLVDFNGSWAASGTPGAVPTGYWNTLSNGDNAHYRVVEWDARENPHMPGVLAYFEKALRRMDGIPAKPWPIDCKTLADFYCREHMHLLPAKFVREYLGLWVMDLQALVYRIAPRNNYSGEIPFPIARTTIGLDLGGAESQGQRAKLDHTAISVCRSTSTLPTIWVPESYKLRDVTIESIMSELCRLIERYPDATVEIDSSSAGVIIERSLRLRGIPVRATVKGPKLRRIQQVQSKIASGNLRLHISKTMALRDEAVTLVWDDKRKEHDPRCEDDAWDSLLYAALPHIGEEELEPLPTHHPKPNSQAARDAQEAEELEEAYRAAVRSIEDEAA